MSSSPLARKLRRFSYWHWAALVLLLAVLDYGYPELSRIVDQRGGDVLLRLHAAKRPASGAVLVVDIDQHSLEELNAQAGSWPWPRSVHAELADYLLRQGARAVVFDILFNEPDVYRPEHDAALAELVAQQPNIYLATVLNETGLGGPLAQMPAGLGIQAGPRARADAHAPVLLPLALASQPAALRGGLINFAEDSDRVGRHYYLFRERAGWRLPSLPARLAHDLGWAQPASDRILLNWRANWQRIAYADLYQDAQREQPLLPAARFRGQIVLIGTAAPGLQDLRLTPLGSTYPGVNILATAIDNLRAGDWLRAASRPWALPFLLALLASLAYGFGRGFSPTRLAYGLLGVSLGTTGLAYLALGLGWWLPVFAPLLFAWLYYWLGALLAYLQERRQRERAIGMFQRFLDPRVVGDLVASGEIDTRVNAESREVTVLFSDIRGFTSLSETRSPAAIVALLNQYFSLQVEIIFRHGGTLDKYIGDAIMAFWGAPVHDPEHARHAVAAAIEMSEALDRFKLALRDLGQDFDIGIGLNSGPAVVGFIGAQSRLDYTAIGDTVNLASRIEGQTKGIARVLVAESTMQAAGAGFCYRDCGVHHVKGREQGVRLYEPTRLPDGGVSA